MTILQFSFRSNFFILLAKDEKCQTKRKWKRQRKISYFHLKKFNIILFEISELWLLGLNIENQFLLSNFVHFQCSEVILFDIEFFSNFVLELSFFSLKKDWSTVEVGSIMSWYFFVESRLTSIPFWSKDSNNLEKNKIVKIFLQKLC